MTEDILSLDRAVAEEWRRRFLEGRSGGGAAEPDGRRC